MQKYVIFCRKVKHFAWEIDVSKFPVFTSFLFLEELGLKIVGLHIKTMLKNTLET